MTKNPNEVSNVQALLICRIVEQMHVFTDSKIQLIQKVGNIRLNLNQQSSIKRAITRLQINGRLNRRNLIAEWERDTQLSEFNELIRGSHLLVPDIAV